MDKVGSILVHSGPYVPGSWAGGMWRGLLAGSTLGFLWPGLLCPQRVPMGEQGGQCPQGQAGLRQPCWCWMRAWITVFPLVSFPLGTGRNGIPSVVLLVAAPFPIHLLTPVCAL